MAKELHLHIYGIIGKDLMGGSVSSKEVADKLASAKDAGEIILHINSPGGSVYEGYTIYNLLKGSGKKISAKVEGVCASIATLIALAADEIELFPLSQWLIHNPMGAVEGDRQELLKAAAELHRIANTLIDLYVAKTGKTPEEITALMNEDRFLSAEEAYDMGFVSAIIQPLKAVAFYDKPNPINMSKLTEQEELGLFDKFKNWLNPKAEGTPDPEPGPVAASESLEDGSEIFFDGSLSEGTAVFTDVELTQPVSDGDHKLASGKTITVAEGKVTAITEAEDPAATALAEKDAEIQNLKDQLTAVQAQATEVTNLKAQVTNLTADLAKAKKVVPGGGNNTPNPPQNFKGDKPAGAHPLDKAAKQIKF